MNQVAENCPERWRKIRDALFRSIKRHSIKRGTRKRKPYYLTSHLQFILDSSILSTTSKTDESYTDDNRVTEYETESENSKPGPFLDETKTNSVQDDFPVNNTNFESSLHHQVNKISANKTRTEQQRTNAHYFEVTDEVESILSKRRRIIEEDDENDSDMNFFKSLLRDVRKMNDKQNRKFRLRVLQIVDEIFDDATVEECPEWKHPIDGHVLFRNRRQNCE
ncbi:uncharacterized protein LOC129910697 isoform X2 [Episyrphus balteatus]|uniref:uncharacterized protein LOC129910697 isoform X2 n=1 Tax=Episyrphus balteatus TaxID=286459 RepID=UPI00248669FC|nr:uncharacterized protein LOC129910697 isoform X2 [Episyrphus balteatus]